MTTFRAGQTHTKPYVFDAARISAFASLSGDTNPLHHDEAAAARSRFKGLIASGPQMSAVLMALSAAMLNEADAFVGLEFTFRFERAIPAGTETILSWMITQAQPHAKLGGTLLTFEGAITGSDGKRYVSANGKAVIWDKPAQSG